MNKVQALPDRLSFYFHFFRQRCEPIPICPWLVDRYKAMAGFDAKFFKESSSRVSGHLLVVGVVSNLINRCKLIKMPDLSECRNKKSPELSGLLYAFNSSVIFRSSSPFLYRRYL